MLLSLHPLPEPTTPPRTQQNMNTLHAYLVTANKKWKGKARSFGQGDTSSLLLSWQQATQQAGLAHGWAPTEQEQLKEMFI